MPPRTLFCFLLAAMGVLSLAAVGRAVDADYLWPVRGLRPEVTSVMCDRRSGHPHGGIDVSLGGRVGTVPIVSVGEGVLMRLRASNVGYGNSVYVRMPDDRVAVYAHLDRFSPRLEKIADELRRRTGLARLDYYYEKWELNTPIARGEVIGYGGKSGTSTAHLHFEIRQDDLVNLNPLTNGFPNADGLAPTIRAVQFTPADGRARVNGGTAPLSVTCGVGGRCGAGQSVRVKGRVGVAVDAADRAAPRGRSFSPYRLAVRVDGAAFFETVYESWSWLDPRVWMAQYERGPAGRELLRAFNPYPVAIPFYSAADAGTFQTLSPGPHEVAVEASDAAGNSTSVTARIVVEADTDVDSRPWPRGSGALILANGSTVSTPDERFSVRAGADALFEPTRIDLQSFAGPPEALGACVAVSGPAVPLRRPVEVGFAYDDPHPARLAVYRFAEGKLDYLGATFEPGADRLWAETLDEGAFCLARDDAVPRVAADGKSLSWRVTDDLAGFDSDAVRVWVGGRRAVVDFDPRTGRARASVYWRPRGERIVTVLAGDRAGNVARRVERRTF